jgi:hypothetical protein
MIVTGTHDPIRARDQLLNKFYAVALVDADTPTPGRRHRAASVRA